MKKVLSKKSSKGGESKNAVLDELLKFKVELLKSSKNQEKDDPYAVEIKELQCNEINSLKEDAGKAIWDEVFTKHLSDKNSIEQLILHRFESLKYNEEGGSESQT